MNDPCAIFGTDSCHYALRHVYSLLVRRCRRDSLRRLILNGLGRCGATESGGRRQESRQESACLLRDNQKKIINLQIIQLMW